MKKIVALIALGIGAAVPANANIVHVVTFRYKPAVTSVQRAVFARLIRRLVTTSLRDGEPYIVSIRGGAAMSHEGYDQRFEQMFMIEFRNLDDRNYFIGPPYGGRMEASHRQVVDIILPHVERDATGKISGSFVFDFSD